MFSASIKPVQQKCSGLQIGCKNASEAGKS